MVDPAELQEALESLLASGRVEVYEDGQLLAELAEFRFEIQRQGKHALLHLWSEEQNLTRRVLNVSARSTNQLALEVQRFGTAKPGRLEFLCPEAQRRAGRLTREKFRARFGQLLAEQFPDERIESLTTAPDLEHSFSGSYARGLMRRGPKVWAVMGISPGEDAATVDAILTFGLLWLDWNRERAQRRAVEGLRLFLPEGAGRITAHRLQALASWVNVELYEIREAQWRVRRLDPSDIGNVATWLTPRREVEHTIAAAGEAIEQVRSFAPDAIDAVVPPGTHDVALRFRGLEFARWQKGRLLYGLPDELKRPVGHNYAALKKLIKKLEIHRTAQAEDTNHALYRGQAERWLEALVLREPSRLDAHLDPRCLYPQVPAFSAGDRGVIDLLGVTRDGRLAVVELKVAEDIHLVLQAVDYWLRVWWHHRQEDFPRYGYFSGVGLQPKPPLLYLVAPGFRFHPATDVILRHLSKDIEIIRIGLNEHWRKGIQVVFRQ